MVYDCFVFFNELDLLEIRLNTLGAHVDRFVLVESDLTFSGNKKPCHYLENRSRYDAFADKIIHIRSVLSGFDPEAHWQREYKQRNDIMLGLLDAKDDDLIIISDVDEIWKAQSCRGKLCSHPNVFSQTSYRWKLNIQTDQEWFGSYIMQYRDLKNSSPQNYRLVRHSMLVIKNGGWHFSWLSEGYADKIDKLEAFSHQELNTDEFKTYLKDDIPGDIFKENLQKVSIDESYPTFILNNMDRFKKYIV